MSLVCLALAGLNTLLRCELRHIDPIKLKPEKCRKACFARDIALICLDTFVGHWGMYALEQMAVLLDDVKSLKANESSAAIFAFSEIVHSVQGVGWQLIRDDLG
jgi:hypothetical protein